MERHGASLLELVVVLALLGLMTTLVVAALDPAAAGEDPVEMVRGDAIRSGRPMIARDSAGHSILFLPDGRAAGRGYDPLTGRRIDDPR